MIYILLADGFEEIEALCPADLLMRAGFDVKLVSITDKLTVRGTHNIKIEADILFDKFVTENAQMIVLPGGMPGASNLLADKKVCDIIKEAFSGGIPLAAICAAPMILGELGLLVGKRAVCYPGYEKNLRGAFLCDEKVVRDGNILTAKGMGVSFDFGIAAISMLSSEGHARKIEASTMRMRMRMR